MSAALPGPPNEASFQRTNVSWMCPIVLVARRYLRQVIWKVAQQAQGQKEEDQKGERALEWCAQMMTSKL